jgi:trehalose synthase
MTQAQNPPAAASTELADLLEVQVSPLSLDRFDPLLEAAEAERVHRAVVEARRRFAGRTIWNVNSTARGGGVAEMLPSLLAYVRGSGVDARWLVISGDAEFFRITKRLHNRLHGAPGDGGPLGEAERAHYQAVLDANATALRTRVRRGDVLILHDPQTAGLVESMRAAGARVVWRCHVGIDLPDDEARQAWDFLRPHVLAADAVVFTREAFAWEGLAPARTWVIPPSIDAFSAKNCELSAEEVDGILSSAGIVEDGTHPHPFRRPDGSPGRVEHRARMIPDRRVPRGERLVVQVSRWDRLKDPVGVLRGFAEHVAPRCDGHLLLAGPEVEAVSDDPEGAEVLAEVAAERARLPAAVAARVHLACLPMTDAEENAIMVNALQRRATIAVQKSLAEGFGLTVAEAMWKARPVVASRIGGIQDQIEDGVSGCLLGDARDLADFGRIVGSLLDDPEGAHAMGERARQRVREMFLGPRHLLRYFDLLSSLD